MGSRLASTKKRTGTALATGAAMAAVAIACGGFAMESSRSAGSAGTSAPGLAALAGLPRGAQARLTGIPGAHLSIRLDPAGVSSPAPGSAVSYLIHIRPDNTLANGVTIVAAATPGLVTITAFCAGRNGRPGHAGRPDEVDRRPVGILSRAVLDALSDNVREASDGPAPATATATCALGPAAAMDLGAGGVVVTVRIPDGVAAGSVVQFAVGAAAPAATEASGTAAQPPCPTRSAGACVGTVTATVTLPVEGGVSPALPARGRTASTPGAGTGVAAGATAAPAIPSPGGPSPGPRRPNPGPGGPSPGPGAPSPGPRRPSPGPGGPSPEPSNHSPGPGNIVPGPSSPSAESRGPGTESSGSASEPSGPTPQPCTPAALPTSPGQAACMGPGKGPTPVGGTGPGAYPSGSSRAGNGAGAAAANTAHPSHPPATGSLHAAGPPPAQPSPPATPPARPLPAQPLPAQPLPAQPPLARPLPAQPLPAQPPLARPLPAQPPLAQPPPGLASGIPPANAYPAPQRRVPANVAPVLPRITAPQTPPAALPDPAGAGPASGLRPEDEVAESGELPAPLGLATAQIIGLALALSAALVALLRPVGLALRSGGPSDGRIGGEINRTGAKKPAVPCDPSDAGGSSGAGKRE
jgi:hypothetical protein